MRRAKDVTLQPHQLLRLPRKITFRNFKEIFRKQVNRHLQCTEQQMSPSNLTNIAHATQNDTPKFHRNDVTLQPHKILPLPRQMTLMIDHRHILWNVIDNAQSKRCHPPTSPITAPATKNYIPKFQRNFPLQPHQILRMPRKMTLQNFTEMMSPSNLTNYCACHKKNKISKKFSENR